MINIDERVTDIKGNNELISGFIAEYEPFIAASVSRKTGRFVGRDEDEYSIGMNAFLEAINTYDRKKGAFLTFASTVIHRRLIDHIRKKKKIFISIEDETSIDAVTAASIDRHKAQIHDQMLRIELDMFAKELEGFNITMERLVKASPKHKSTKQLYTMVASYIASDRELTEQIITKGYLPIEKLSKETSVNRKKIERGRDYIIACTIITHGDYQYLKEYVRLGVNV